MQPAPAKSGFFREGFSELRRKIERNRLRKQLGTQGRERDTALVALGSQAWREKLGLEGFDQLREQLTTLERRAGEVSQRIQSLQSEGQKKEEERRAETAKYDERRQAVERDKKPVDDALHAARQRAEQQDLAVKRSAARLAAIAAELAALEAKTAGWQPGASAPPATALADAQAKHTQLAAEREQLAAAHPALEAPLGETMAEVKRLWNESGRYQEQIDAIETERRSVIAPIEAAMERIKTETAAARKEATAVAEETNERFRQLGLAVYERKPADPGLQEALRQVAAIDRLRQASGAAVEASLALTRAMPPGTMLKFSLALLAAFLAVGALGYGAYAGWNWWRGSRRANIIVPEEARAPINRYLSHPLSGHPAYVLANRLSDADSQAAVAEHMLEAFGAIHLGVYAPDGRKILAGAERGPKDFFLYDFQWKTLARAFYNEAAIDWESHAQLLGRSLLRLDDPAQLAPLLNRGIVLRYQEAVLHPDDPMSFLILLADGLARQQVKPYSLSEVESRPQNELFVDPLQSFLLMLDFFTQAPKKPGSAAFRRLPFWNIVPSVHADSACDAIAGEKEQGNWGKGLAGTIFASEQLGEQLAGKASGAAQAMGKAMEAGGKAAGAVTDIADAVGDLVMLYGITIHVKPQPYVVHLRHDNDVVASFAATVTFEPDGVPAGAVQCGWMAGKSMPAPNTPLKDVELTWKIEPWPPYLIVPHEMVQQLTGHLGFQTKTDLNGKSLFWVTATDCPEKTGRVVGRDLMMTVTARVLTTKMPMPGPLAVIGLVAKLGPGAIEYLMNGRTGYARFRVEWHKQAPKTGQY